MKKRREIVTKTFRRVVSEGVQWPARAARARAAGNGWIRGEGDCLLRIWLT